MSLRRPPPRRPPRELAAETILAQYGREVDGQQTFRNGPRADRETSQSMTIGPCSAEEVARIVLGRPVRASDRVRHTTVGELRAAGFVVTSTPTVRNPDHVSVAVPGNRVPWNDQEEARFDSCFAE
ncbi:hypothetical protein KRM28CT15_60910 [Krasilnikovia sp. M28-CT-15]